MLQGLQAHLTGIFQFIVKKPNSINMISTSDPDFAYGMFSGRVRNKEIEIQRLSGSSVLLRIKHLLDNDAGVICSVRPYTQVVNIMEIMMMKQSLMVRHLFILRVLVINEMIWHFEVIEREIHHLSSVHIPMYPKRR